MIPAQAVEAAERAAGCVFGSPANHVIPARAVKGMRAVNEALDLLLAGHITPAEYLKVVDASYEPPNGATK